MPQAQRMLDEPTAQPGQFGLWHVPFGMDDSDQHDDAYGDLDHKEPALVVLFLEADD